MEIENILYMSSWMFSNHEEKQNHDIDKKTGRGQVWWCMSLLPVLSSKPAWSTWRVPDKSELYKKNYASSSQCQKEKLIKLESLLLNPVIQNEKY